MMPTYGINSAVLVPFSKVLLTGTAGFSILSALRGTIDLDVVIERLVVSTLALVFFQAGGEFLLKIANDLNSGIVSLGKQQDLKALILDALQKSAGEGNPSGGFNLPGFIGQAWRTGVWGVMTLAVDWLFLVVSFLLECAREVFWQLVLILFPISCGLYPVFPRMMTNLAIYAVELALWFPVLSLVDVITSAVARSYLTKSESLGLYIVAVELLACILILLIPSMTHKFLSGAFSGDFEAQSSILRNAKRAMIVAKGWGTGL